MNQYKEILTKIKNADAIIIGASNGLSISEGLHIFANNQKFDELFGDFKRKYGINNILEGFFYHWNSLEEKWGFLSRLIDYYTFNYQPTTIMKNLLTLINDKPYFVVTSNGEGHFEKSGFNKDNVYEIEGNWIEMRCSDNCHDKTYPSLDIIHKMALHESNGVIPSELIVYCPYCQAPMKLYDSNPPKKIVIENWKNFLKQYHNKNIVILELGIGWRNQLIKAPLMKLTNDEPNATYITINLGEIYISDNIKEKSFALDGYLDKILAELVSTYNKL